MYRRVSNNTHFRLSDETTKKKKKKSFALKTNKILHWRIDPLVIYKLHIAQLQNPWEFVEP